MEKNIDLQEQAHDKLCQFGFRDDGIYKDSHDEKIIMMSNRGKLGSLLIEVDSQGRVNGHNFVYVDFKSLNALVEYINS